MGAITRAEGGMMLSHQAVKQDSDAQCTGSFIPSESLLPWHAQKQRSQIPAPHCSFWYIPGSSRRAYFRVRMNTLRSNAHSWGFSLR